MCGIIGAFNSNNKPVNEWVVNQLQDQISRGRRGFGIILIDEDKKIKIKRATELTKTLVDLYLNKANKIILHHRMPTSSENKIQETHPILVNNKKLKHKYYVIHNGVIRNSEELIEKHKKAGFKYTTLRKKNDEEAQAWKETEFNDSECFAIEIAKFIDKNLKTIDIQGSWAFIALQVNKKTNEAERVFYGKNDIPPLRLSATRNKIRLSSEGCGNDIKDFHLYSFDINDLKIKKERKIKIKKEKKAETKKVKEEIEIIDYNHKKQTNFNSSNPVTTSPTNYFNSKDKTDDDDDDEYYPELIIEEATEKINQEIDNFFEIITDENFLYTVEIKDEIQDLLLNIIPILKKAFYEYKQAKTELSLEKCDKEIFAKTKENDKYTEFCEDYYDNDNFQDNSNCNYSWDDGRYNYKRDEKEFI